MSIFWPGHPLFSASNLEEAAARLDVFNDGMIALRDDGGILSLNSAARRMLGLDPDISYPSLESLLGTCEGWDGLLTAFEENRQGDIGLRGLGSRPLLATLTGRTEAERAEWVLLRDVEAFEFRRDRRFSPKEENNVHFISAAKTRPDFAAQRQLCPEINRLLSRGERAIRQGARILITGESGVGKSEIARFLHSAVSVARDPFVIVNCASSSERQFDALLFGREKDGQWQPGLIEQAEGGTLFLDEIGEIPLSTQAKLLGFLEDGRLPHMWGQSNQPKNVRVISATNRDLRKMASSGRFRADLYFRLAVVELLVPPLRDLTPLVNHLIDRFAQTINQRRHVPVIIPQRVRDVLLDYSFPGNIRELLNIVQRISIFLEDVEQLDEILAGLLAPINTVDSDSSLEDTSTATLDLRVEVKKFERALIDKAIRIHGSKRKAAKALGVDIGTVVRKTADSLEESPIEKLTKQGN